MTASPDQFRMPTPGPAAAKDAAPERRPLPPAPLPHPGPPAGTKTDLREVARLRGDHPVRRLAQLYVGLVLYGVSMALLVQANVGVMPWDVLHQGIARRTGSTIGVVSIVVGAIVLLGWIPLRQRPGIGTVSNVIVIGIAVDAALLVLPAPDALAAQVAFLIAGVVLNAIATAAYIGARLGPGPRDGLMTGLVHKTGRSVRLVRTSIEVAVVAAGWLLGGTLGVGTALYALVIGPLVHIFLPWLRVASAREADVRIRG